MAETKTRPTGVDVDAFVAAVGDPVKRADSRRLIDMMTRLTGEPPAMWGPTMIGFGRYHYRYDSGHEGDAFLTGFSPRKSAISLYVLGGYLPGFDRAREEALLARLGKHSVGKSCLYVKRLSDIDMAVLEELAALSIAWTRARYPEA
jgi:hypothetical protein